jgi:hypothetical protein
LNEVVELYMSIYNELQAECSLKKCRGLTEKFARFLRGVKEILLDFAHKKDLYRVSMTAVKYGLVMARFDSEAQGRGKT